MKTYPQQEFAETAPRLFAPSRAINGCIKDGITKLQKACGISSWHRARELWLGRTRPTVEEMDRLRELDGRWCNKARRAVQPLMERMHERIEDVWEAIQKFKPIAERVEKIRIKREARLSQKHITERLYDRA
jgi:hypothetical protein